MLLWRNFSFACKTNLHEIHENNTTYQVGLNFNCHPVNYLTVYLVVRYLTWGIVKVRSHGVLCRKSITVKMWVRALQHRNWGGLWNFRAVPKIYFRISELQYSVKSGSKTSYHLVKYPQKKDWPQLVIHLALLLLINTLRSIQNGRLFADDNFTGIFLNENVWISLKISLKFVPGVRINNIPSLVQIMAWRRRGDKPLSEPMVVSFLTHYLSINSASMS